MLVVSRSQESTSISSEGRQPSHNVSNDSATNENVKVKEEPKVHDMFAKNDAGARSSSIPTFQFGDFEDCDGINFKLGNTKVEIMPEKGSSSGQLVYSNC